MANVTIIYCPEFPDEDKTIAAIRKRLPRPHA